jgi:hypothetical protein
MAVIEANHSYQSSLNHVHSINNPKVFGESNTFLVIILQGNWLKQNILAVYTIIKWK